MKHSFWIGLLLLGIVTPAAAQDAPAAPAEPGDQEGEVVDLTGDGWPAAEAEQPAAEDDQAQDQEQAPPQAQSPEAEEAPAEPPVPNEEPAILESPTPTAVTAEQSEQIEPPADADEPEQLPWRNSLFMWDHSLNTTALDASSTITHDPTYVWSFTLMPRYYVNDTMFFRVRQDMTYELTDTDSYAHNHQAIFADTQLDFVESGLLSVGNLTGQGGVRVIAPTSIASRANDVYFGTGLFGATQYTIPDVLAGLIFSGNASWSHYFAGSNVTASETDYPCYVNDVNGAAQVCSQVGGPSTVSDSIVAGLAVSLMPIPELTLSTGFTWLWRIANGLADASVPVDGAPGGEITLADMSQTHLRGLTYYSASASYQFTDWFNLSANFYTFTTQISPDGSRRNPFFNVNSSVSLTMTVSLAALYGELTGTAEAHTDPNQLRRSAQGPHNRQMAAGRGPTMW